MQALHQQKSSFPLHTGQLDSCRMQGPMCQTPRTLIHTCNQTQSRFVPD